MASQSAKTETMFNIAAHRLDDGPFVPIMIVEPTEKLVRSTSNGRFKALIESTPSLLERLAPGQADKVVEKFFAGIRLGFAWAGSATELASHPNGVVLLDEVDRMPDDVGGEGDPVTISAARTTTFWNRLIALFSSPTIEGASKIWKWFLTGTKYRWAWECPHCLEYFVPSLERLKWPKKCTPAEARESAFMECPNCHQAIGDRYRRSMNATGRYIPHVEDKEGRLVPCETPEPNSVASFWVSGLASPFVSFGESAEQMVRAYQSGDQEKIQAVINTRFGELYKIKGQIVTTDEVERLRAAYHPKTIPQGVQLITGGIDVQKSGFYVTVRGWGFLSESWLLFQDHIIGDTDLDQVWILLSRVVNMEISGAPVRRWLIDCGYRPGDKWRVDQHMVKKFVLRHPGRVSPSFGRRQLNSAEVIKKSEMTLEANGQKFDTGIPQFFIDTDHFKQWLHSRYKHPLGEPGAFHLHSDTPEWYLRHLVSEEMVLAPSGARIWKIRQGYENHAFDCEVMARVAAVLEGVDHLPPLSDPNEKPQKKQTEYDADPVDDWMAGYD